MGDPGAKQEVRNERALFVYNRVQHKLTGKIVKVESARRHINLTVNIGRDFNPDVVLTVPAQVEKLISQATSLENLCQCFSGWYVFQAVYIYLIIDIEGCLGLGVHSGDFTFSLGSIHICIHTVSVNLSTGL